MGQQDRRSHIVAALQAEGRVEVVTLAQRFGVSEMTVRRDLEALERQGVLRRIHGGAMSAPSRSYEPPYALRETQQVEPKERIGKTCAGLLSDGETLFLDIGSTALSVAHALVGRINLTVITPSLRIATVLAEEDGIQLVCLGGTVRPGERSLVGFLAQQNLQNFYPDTCVLGVGGVDSEAGLTEFNLDDAVVKQTALARARRTVVVADESKLGRIAFASIGPIRTVDDLVTDAPSEHSELTGFTSMGLRVHHA